MSTTTQATERTADHDSVERDVAAIKQALDHLRRLMADRSMRRDNATAAGATLAYEVERFLDDPEGVGTDALRAAWSTFMGRHSGDFTDSVMAVDDQPATAATETWRRWGETVSGRRCECQPGAEGSRCGDFAGDDGLCDHCRIGGCHVSR